MFDIGFWELFLIAYGSAPIMTAGNKPVDVKDENLPPTLEICFIVFIFFNFAKSNIKFFFLIFSTSDITITLLRKSC